MKVFNGKSGNEIEVDNNVDDVYIKITNEYDFADIQLEVKKAEELVEALQEIIKQLKVT